MTSIIGDMMVVSRLTTVRNFIHKNGEIYEVDIGISDEVSFEELSLNAYYQLSELAEKTGERK